MVKEYSHRAALVLILLLVAISSQAQTIITPVSGVATVDIGMCGQGGPSPNPSCTFKLTLTANTTLAFNNVFGGANINLFINPGTFTLTWPSSVPILPSLTASANNFVSMRYDGTSGTWLLTSGSGGAAGAPQQSTIRISTQCSGTDVNCFQVFQDGQLSVGSTWSANTSNGTTATLLTTNDNDSGAQYLQMNTAQTNIGGIFTASSGSDNSILAAFKISGTLGAPASCSGTNDTAASATTIAVGPFTPASSGSGSILIGWAATTGPDQASITFSDNNGNTWANVLPVPNIFPSSSSVQMGYVQNNNSGATTVTATFGASATFRSIFVCNFSGMASSNVLDAAVGGLSAAGVATIMAGTLSTTGNDLLFQAARSNGTGTFTVGTIGVPVNTITTNSFDPPYTAAQVGQKVVLSTTCQSANGFIGSCLPAITNPSAKIIAVNSAHNITVNTLFNISNLAPDAHGFTGWLVSAHDDGAQYAAAFAKAITVPGSTLLLPCGMAIIGQEPFNEPVASFPAWSPNITGCSGAVGTTLVPSLDFNYPAAVGGIIANIQNNNSKFSGGPTIQSPTIWGKLEKFAIWGLGIGGTSLSLPIINVINTEIDNVDCTGFAYNTTNPFVSGLSLRLNNAHAWICGSTGVSIAGDAGNSTEFSSIRNSYLQNSGPSITLSGGHLESDNNSLYGFGASCSGGGNYSINMTGGTLNSRNDRLAGVFATAGTANFDSTLNSFVGVCAMAINISGTASVAAHKAWIDIFTMSAGSFYDLGDNFHTAVGTPWTNGTLTVTGGTVIGTNSVTGVAITAPKLVLSAGWGTTAAWTSLSGFTKRIQGTITASGTGQAANPTITYTFPTPFAQATNIVCKGTQTGGTQAAVANPFTVGVPTAASVVFTYTGTPGAGSTLVVVLECDAQ